MARRTDRRSVCTYNSPIIRDRSIRRTRPNHMFFKVNFYNANQQLMRLPSLSLHCFFPNKSSSGVLNVASSPPCGPVELPSPRADPFLPTAAAIGALETASFRPTAISHPILSIPVPPLSLGAIFSGYVSLACRRRRAFLATGYKSPGGRYRLFPNTPQYKDGRSFRLAYPEKIALRCARPRVSLRCEVRKCGRRAKCGGRAGC